MLIFVVDDEDSVREETKRTIQEADPTAEVADYKRAADALEAIRCGKRADVVFSDIEMPGLSGLEFAVKLKGLSPDTRIVFVTGYREYAVEAFKIKVHGYLLKPLSVDDIREELKYIEHKPVFVQRKEATCVAEGNIAYFKCEECGWYFTDGAHPGTTWIDVGDEVIPINPNAHSWGEWIVTKEPTDTEEGEEKHICKLCGAEETRVIPKVTPGTISYNVVEGSGQTWMKGSGSTADFVAKRSVYDQNTFKHFTGIRVDGNSVDRSYYTAESGSVIIKIKPEYLNTLSIGKHTLEIDFDDGKVSTEFYVAESKEGSGGGGGSDDSGVLAAVNPLANIMPFLPGMPDTGDSAGKSGSKFNGPNTGDESMIYTWLIIFVVSAGILVLALRPAIQTYLRRRKKTETK